MAALAHPDIPSQPQHAGRNNIHHHTAREERRHGLKRLEIYLHQCPLQSRGAYCCFAVFTSVAHLAVHRPQPHLAREKTHPFSQMNHPALDKDGRALGCRTQVGAVDLHSQHRTSGKLPCSD